MRVFLDNAATTPMAPEVLAEMMPYFTTHYGNPSSIHHHGREARAAIERARKKVADLLGAAPAEIFFTSCGTEADNTVLCNAVHSLGVQHLVTSKVEHHAVLHTAEWLARQHNVKVSYVELNGLGEVDLAHLEHLIGKQEKTLISLMHGNNEVGNLLPLEEVGELCHQKKAFFHSDTVQTLGHYVHNFAQLPLDFAVGSAHKLNGPKGIGLLYIQHDNRIDPFIHGGAQERNMRGGTENVAGIVGFAKAIEMAYEGMDAHRTHIQGLKQMMIQQLKEQMPDVLFNGLSGDLDKSLYTVLNVCLPPSEDNDMLLFNLDIDGISASGGSACSSGSNMGSHVLAELDIDPDRGAVRFSFGKYNTPEEITFAVDKLVARYAGVTS